MTCNDCIPEIIVGLPYVLSMVSMRSYVTALANKSEVSAIMALVSLIDNVVPLISTLLLTYIFNLTSVSFPGCFFVVIAAVNLIPVGLGL